MFEDCLNQFEFYLHNTKKSSNNTISSYKRDLQKYCRYLEDNGITDCLKANNNDVNNYISE